MRSSNTYRNPRRLGAGAALLLAALVGLGRAEPAFAVDPDRTMSQYLRERWESDKGFPGGAVYAMAQSSDGYLWIAAEKGLVRFDGLTFRLLQPKRLTSGPDATVLGLTADPDGSLWVQLRSALLMRYRHDTFEDSGMDGTDANPAVTAMSRGLDGTVLLSLVDRGVMESRAGGFATVVAQGALPSSFVIAMAQTNDGDIWLGTRDSGLLRVHQRRVTPVTNGLPDQKVNSLLAGDHGELWIGTDNGVVRWNGTEITRAGLPAELEHTAALAMMRDRDGNVWIAASSGGLLRVNARGLARLDAADSRPRSAVTSVLEDRDGNVWIGTTRGIERLRDGVFTTYSTAQGLPSASYGPVAVESDRVWTAPADGGLLWFGQGRVVPVELAGLSHDVVYAIASGGGEVWLGRQRGGLTRLRADGDGFTARSFSRTDGLAQNNVYAVERAHDGSIWAGTLSAGVSRFRDGVFTTYTTEDGLASNTVASIVEAADGTMWFATPNGASHLSDGGWGRYTTVEGLPSNDVSTIYEDSAHDIWVGTVAGLVRIHLGVVQPLLHVPPPLRGSILGLVEDGRGSLWIETADRVMRLDRARLLRGDLDAESLREYGVADGLPGVEGVKRHKSLVGDGRGRIWLSVNGGISMADPSRADGRVAEVLVHVEDVLADGQSLGRRGDIVVPPRRQRVTLAFTGLSLAVPERVRFRYLLENFDRDWGEPSSAREAVYTNLGPGSYRFRVRASNSEGVWNGREATVHLLIQPAFWQTMWFRLCVVLVIAAACWSAYQLRVHQVAQQLNQRFEGRLQERTRIAQELHDTLLQGFISASMQLHVMAERLPPDSPSKAPMGRVLALMGRVIEEGRNAVRGLRSTAGGPYDLEQAFSGIGEELAITRDTDFRVIVEGHRKPVNPAIRDEVYRIGREGLVNAFRHSGAARIEIELEFAARELRLLVRDNGRGIDPAVLETGTEGHWGLSGMRERAERIGARFKVWSRADSGTEIELAVPGRLAFQKGDRAS